MIAFASRSLGSAPEPAASAAAIESPAAVEPAVSTIPTQEVPLDEISPEVLASLGDPGKRAIEAERDKRKAKAAELAVAQAEIERLKALIPASAAAPGAAVEAPVAPAPETPRVPVVPVLAECKTSLEVDAAVMHATQQQALAMELNTVLNTEGLSAVLERFQAGNITTFRGTPVNELTPAILARELAQTYQHGEAIKLSAPQQKAIIDTTRASMGQAVTILPGLKDPNSGVRKEFNALASNPAVRSLGPDWPLCVAQQIIGRESVAKAQTATAPAVATLPPTPTPQAGSGPGAPRVSVPPPQPATVNDAVLARLSNGTATELDMKQLASASLRAGVPLKG
jgi:hypothetical protein